MNDLKPFVHGEEGTHSCCNKRLKEEGGKATCCTCNPHEGCEDKKIMKHYRKRPVVIEAVQWLGDANTFNALCKLFPHQVEVAAGDEGMELRIQTLEGIMTAKIEDWIIKGVAGEIYPCKPDIFEKTYQAV